MKSKKETSPLRSRDKVIQSLYEIELSGSDFKDILADLALQSRYPHFKDLLTGVINSREDIDNMLAKNMDRKLSSLDPIERSTLRLATYELLYTKTDAPIIINESIRLSK